MYCCLAPKKDGTEAIGSKQSLAAAEGLFQERNSKVWDTHALRAEARRGGGAREQQAQHEQQRYTMHDDEGPHGRSRNCRSQVPLKPAGRSAKPGPRSALRPALPRLQAPGGTSPATPPEPPASAPPSTAYRRGRASGPRGGAECRGQNRLYERRGRLRAELREGARLKGRGRAERKGRDCVRGVAKRGAGRAGAGLNVEKQLATRGWAGPIWGRGEALGRVRSLRKARASIFLKF